MDLSLKALYRRMLLDRAHFDAMTAGDAGLQLEIAGLFRAQVQAWGDALTPEGDWRRAAHTMKGSARGIGLWPLAQACEAAEAAQDRDVALRLQALRAALADAMGALDELTRELKTP